MSDLSLDAHATGATEALLPLLQRRQLSYTARSAQQVLLSVTAEDGPPDVCLRDPFGDEPVLVVGGRTVPSGDFTYENLTLTWATGAGADRTTGFAELFPQALAEVRRSSPGGTTRRAG